MDEFEERLAEGIIVPSKERQGGEEETCLYGAEYYALEDGVVGVELAESGSHRSRAKPTRSASFRTS